MAIQPGPCRGNQLLDVELDRAVSRQAAQLLGQQGDEPTAFSGKPTLILWGLKNTAFRRKELERWKHELSNVQVHEFQNCGHFPEEEVPDPLVPLLQSFMGRTR